MCHFVVASLRHLLYNNCTTILEVIGVREMIANGYSTESYIIELRQFVNGLKMQSPSDPVAKREAKEALIRTGVLTKKGKKKKKIVSWE